MVNEVGLLVMAISTKDGNTLFMMLAVVLNEATTREWGKHVVNLHLMRHWAGSFSTRQKSYWRIETITGENS